MKPLVKKSLAVLSLSAMMTTGAAHAATKAPEWFQLLACRHKRLLPRLRFWTRTNMRVPLVQLGD
ncbi:hypothetical protein SAMN04487897_11689 [Paenibacillus sp. yr247]|uniref:hypothetical protein n=1 Tax=Paenibacillus sp. yr247 TaxID=1761880 RepID=UPI00088FA513|nr:hypothetical protein [Paenibacillus sp. yr247]SDO54747.1 hypothetical protein SAMN04487897_11689 [Paenibacillus sp. yr247]